MRQNKPKKMSTATRKVIRKMKLNSTVARTAKGGGKFTGMKKTKVSLSKKPKKRLMKTITKMPKMKMMKTKTDMPGRKKSSKTKLKHTHREIK